MIAAAAGFIIGILNVTGLSFALTIALVHIGAGNCSVLLVLAAAIAIVLGMGMPTVGVYVLLAALVAPALTEVGDPAARRASVRALLRHDVDDDAAGRGRGLAAASIARPIRCDRSRRGRFGWSAYIVPFLFVMSPTLLMQGSALDVTLAFLTARLGIYLVSVGGGRLHDAAGRARCAGRLRGRGPGADDSGERAFEGAIWTDVGGASWAPRWSPGS